MAYKFEYTICQCHQRPLNCLLTLFCPWASVGYLWHKTSNNCCRLSGLICGLLFFLFLNGAIATFIYTAVSVSNQINDGTIENSSQDSNFVLFFKSIFTQPLQSNLEVSDWRPIRITWTWLPLFLLTFAIVIAVLVRWKVRHHTKITTNSPFRDCLTASCCLQCALCQEMNQIV